MMYNRALISSSLNAHSLKNRMNEFDCNFNFLFAFSMIAMYSNI